LPDHAGAEEYESQSATTENEIRKLSRRFLIILVVPLIVIVILGLYTIYLSRRVVTLETYAETFSTLQEANTIERYYANDRNVAWATDQYEKIVKRHPDPRLLTRLAGLYVSKGDHGKASTKLNEAIKLDPSYWETRSVLMYVYVQQGKEADAIQEGERAVKLNPFDVMSLNNLAWLYATSSDKGLQDMQKAKEYATRAVDYTNARNADVLDTLAEIQFRLGDARAAVATIEKGLRQEQRKVEYLGGQRERFAAAARK